MIDKPKDITPDKLRKYAFDVRYAGRDHAARVIEWTADLIGEMDHKLERVKDLPEGAVLAAFESLLLATELNLSSVQVALRIAIDTALEDE